MAGNLRIGVLALQGAFAEHFVCLRRLGAEAHPIRLPEDLNGLHGLVIPGGESTTMGHLLSLYGLGEKLRRLTREGLPIMGTCAGMILLAKNAHPLPLEPLAAMDIKVLRNAFGRQVDSFEVDLAIPVLGEEPFRAIFIRAPTIEQVGPEVEVLAQLPNGSPVAACQGNLVATAFHPELTPDLRFHSYFLDLVAQAKFQP